MFADNILDIKFSNGKAYLLKNTVWNTQKIKERLEQINYTGMRRQKDDKVENAKLPSIAAVFYKYIFIKDQIPSEDELFDSYFKEYCVKLKDLCMIKHPYCKKKELYKIDSLKARVLRAYPSLIRDFHFYVMCYESGLFDTVSYSLKTDFKDGIDIVIELHDEVYGVALNTATRRSQDFKKKKYKRHDYSNIKEIHIEIDLRNTKKSAGDFKLYEEKCLKTIADRIEEFELQG